MDNESLSLLVLALVLVASALGGAVNAIAGGGTLLTFPALVGLGVPPLTANATSTVSLWPGALSSMWGYRGELGETLVQLTKTGRTLIVTTHDDDFAREFASRVIILAEGDVVEEGDAREVLTHPKHPATRALLAGSVAQP